MVERERTVVAGTLNFTSPSAIEAFRRCETAWWLAKVAHTEERILAAIRAAQGIGTEAHAQLERYQLTGQLPTDPLALALLQYAPPRGPDVIVEGSTAPLLVAAGIQVRGRIDWAHGRIPTRPIVADWKTRSDLDKYAKTPAELEHDVQMVCYAKWATLNWTTAETVDVAHYYVETKHHKEFGQVVMRDFPPRTQPLLINFGLDLIEREWETIVRDVERMKVVAAEKIARGLGHPVDVKARDAACQAFAGCGYKWACPHQPPRPVQVSVLKILSSRRNNLEPTDPAPRQMTLTELLRSKQTVAPTAPVTPAPVSPTPPTDGILPPDAAPNTNPAKEPAPVLVPAPPSPTAAPTAPEPAAEPAAEQKHAHTYNLLRVCTGCEEKKRGPIPGKAAAKELAKQADTGSVTEALPEPQASGSPQVPPQAPSPARVSDPLVPGPVAARPSLVINSAATGSGIYDLTGYVALKAGELAKASGMDDIRFPPDKSSPMAYGQWKGALAALVREGPPSGTVWSIWTKGDELAEVVAATLAPMAGLVVRGA